MRFLKKKNHQTKKNLKFLSHCMKKFMVKMYFYTPVFKFPNFEKSKCDIINKKKFYQSIYKKASIKKKSNKN